MVVEVLILCTWVWDARSVYYGFTTGVDADTIPVSLMDVFDVKVYKNKNKDKFLKI